LRRFHAERKNYLERQSAGEMTNDE
jgi:hypothetical protein